MHRFDSSLVEKLADLLFEISKDQSKKLLHHEVVKWLERAHDNLISQKLVSLGSDAGELLVSIKHLLAKTYLVLKGKENMSKAWNMVHGLDIASGSKLAFLLLKLDLYDSDPSSLAQEYCDVLQKIVHTIYLTDSNLKTTLHHVYKLRLRSPRMAHTTLETLLLERLSHTEEPGWTEKTLVTMIWNCTTSSDLADALNQLTRVLNALYANSRVMISPSAAHAAQVVSTFTYSRKSQFLRYIFVNDSQASMEAHRGKLQSRDLRKR